MTRAKRDPLVSIVLPAHNRADVLGFAIRSVLYQTFDDWELLIVGDGCTDDTAGVVAEFLGDPRITWTDLPKAPGIGYANRNAALRKARGQYVAYMPHDDIWLIDHLERLVATATEFEAEFVYSRFLRVDRRGTMSPATFNLDVAVARGDLQLTSMRIGIGSVLHTKECLDKYGYWEEEGIPGGDHRLWVRFIEGGGRRSFAFHPEPTILHFLADWRRTTEPGWLRKSRGEILRGLGVLDELAPPIMKVDVPPGMTEQEAVWREMTAGDPARWARDLRRGVQAFLDGQLSRTDDFVPLAAGALGAKAVKALADVRRAVAPRRSPREQGKRDEQTRRLEEDVRRLRDRHPG